MADWPAIVASLDTTQEGQSAPLYYAEEGPQICRDHFRPLDLWWDAGHGMMSFHMDPPILFVGYRVGTFKNSRGLIFRRAVYETFQESFATDPAGNQWRFRGRFNALCRAGQLDIGPIVVGGQVVIAENPIDRPILIRSACNGGGEPIFGWAEYDPYDPANQDEDCEGEDEGGGGGSGIQYGEGDFTNGETVDWNTGMGNGGVSACGQAARVEKVCVEIWNDVGQKWDIYACGYATTC
ncbi:MAG TPA: hypothetical protein VGB15_10255 [Longimicrobium sp.]|jgi:hypothetical protein